ncbi:MAG: mannosyltransferase family protein [Caldilineaceae bacterium]
MTLLLTRGKRLLTRSQSLWSYGLHTWLRYLELTQFWQERALVLWAQMDWLFQPALVFALSRLLIFGVGLIGDVFLATAENHWVADPSSLFLSMWAKWDSQWYVQIARDGYTFQPLGQSNVAFFPLYPLLMRLLALALGGNFVFAGFLISMSAFFVALIVLYQLAQLELKDRDAARRTLYYLAFFPTAFFFHAVYTESLFLLLALSATYFARKQQWAIAAACGLLAAATRNLGIVLWGLVMWEWLRHHGWRITQIHRRQTWLNLWRAIKRHWSEPLLLAAIPVGLLLYIFFLKLNFERPFAFIEAQAAWGRQNIGPLAVLYKEIIYLPNFKMNMGGVLHILNLMVTLSVLATIPFIWRKLGEGYALYVLILLLVPISSALMSVIRYVLTLFPVFILLGGWGRHAWVDRFLLTVFAALLGVLTTVFVNWYFIA